MATRIDGRYVFFLRRGIGRRGQQGHSSDNGKRGSNNFQTHEFLAGGPLL